MKQALLLLVFAGFVLLLSGCTTVADRSWTRCYLIQIAFDEQDDLAPGWFDSALKELQTCGMTHYSEDAAKDRGRK